MVGSAPVADKSFSPSATGSQERPAGGRHLVRIRPGSGCPRPHAGRCARGLSEDGEIDAAVLFAPVGDLVPVALRALDRGGTLAVAGIYLSDIPALNYERDLVADRVNGAAVLIA